MKKLGWGIIGCGVISPWHIYGVNRAKDAQLIAVSDVVEEKAIKLAEKEKVIWYTDYTKMLKREDIDVVSICTPSSFHCEVAIAAAQSGKHVLVEKPMAITLEDTDRMIEICQRAKVKLGAVFQLRFSDTFRKVKKVIQEGELGRLVLGDAYLKYYRSQDYYDSADWRGTWEFDGGGSLMNQGIHGVDLLQWLMGDVDTIYGYAHTLSRKIEVEDTAVAVLRFKNKALGIIEATTSVYPSTIPYRIEIHGEKGTIMIEGGAIVRWEIMGKDGALIDKIGKTKEAPKAVTSPTDFSMEEHARQIADMVQTIKDDREPLVNGVEGRKAVEIIISIYRSSKTKKPMKLPLN